MKAIVILYDGEEPSVAAVTNIAQVVAINCKASQVDPVVMNEDDIAKILVKSVGRVARNKVEKEPLKEQITPEDNALIVVGKIFAVSLMSSSDLLFYRALVAKTAEIAENHSADPNNVLKNALHILSRENLVVSKELLKKYHFNAKKLGMIKQVYQIFFT